MLKVWTLKIRTVAGRLIQKDDAMIRSILFYGMVLLIAYRFTGCKVAVDENTGSTSSGVEPAEEWNDPFSIPLMHTTPANLTAGEIEISAKALDEAYKEDTASANALYQGKRIRVTGKIAEIVHVSRSVRRVDLAGSTPIITMMRPRRVEAILNQREISKIGSFQAGQLITLTCTGNGTARLSTTPELSDCRIDMPEETAIPASPQLPKFFR